MGKLISIGKCMVDPEQVIAIEPHKTGYHGSVLGAKISLANGIVVYEEGATLAEVKARISAAQEVKP
ncbi:hypothetical protein R9X49_06495 [Pectobacterium carotovorum]|uniref:hypothetical protein n=1 Tax=Pectobacterium carotovorum TaxID=554 RepID=UPI0029DD12FE|nr:hypothetical protein [Pectobacterium carotovorum]MDX6914755.1 hypothetical protein [Pectobacterium carotovorum]